MDSALVKGLVLVVDINPFGMKLCDVLIDVTTNLHIWPAVVQCSAVFAVHTYWRDGTGNRCMTLAFERHFGGLFDSEALLGNVTLILDFRDGDEITQPCLIFDPSQPLASDDDVHAM